ncbi:MAG: SOS response-associated peptidase family protein, partial [Cyanobacteria bacterium J06635_15]
MCGRYSQTQSGETIATAFNLTESPALEPRYNIAPTQQVSAVMATAESPVPQHRWLRWGFSSSHHGRHLLRGHNVVAGLKGRRFSQIKCCCDCFT